MISNCEGLASTGCGDLQSITEDVTSEVVFKADINVNVIAERKASEEWSHQLPGGSGIYVTGLCVNYKLSLVNLTYSN